MQSSRDTRFANDFSRVGVRGVRGVRKHSRAFLRAFRTQIGERSQPLPYSPTCMIAIACLHDVGSDLSTPSVHPRSPKALSRETKFRVPVRMAWSNHNTGEESRRHREQCRKYSLHATSWKGFYRSDRLGDMHVRMGKVCRPRSEAREARRVVR